MKKSALALAIVGLIMFAAQKVGAENAAPIVLASSQRFVADSTKVQHFSDNIELKKGQEQLQLTLTYFDGIGTAPSFKWLRIASPSMNYVSEQQFMGKKTLSVDVTGELTWGGNQLLITAAGQPGSTFAWELTTPKPTVTGADTTPIDAGGHLTIYGTNFCPNPAGNAVTINGEAAHCVSATANKLTVTVPQDAQSGKCMAAINVAGIDCGSVPFTVNAQPYLTKLSQSWQASGLPLTIYGENFSSDVNSIVVYVGPQRAPVVSASPTQITITIPLGYYTAWAGYYMPVKVTVNGVKARNTLSVSCAVDAM